MDDEDFVLDVTFTESVPAVAGLMRNTDDDCGQTCESACANSTCVAP
ncbi:FxLD family lanthipeptide [Streptomyces sp. NPDC003077]